MIELMKFRLVIEFLGSDHGVAIATKNLSGDDAPKIFWYRIGLRSEKRLRKTREYLNETLKIFLGTHDATDPRLVAMREACIDILDTAACCGIIDDDWCKWSSLSYTKKFVKRKF